MPYKKQIKKKAIKEQRNKQTKRSAPFNIQLILIGQYFSIHFVFLLFTIVNFKIALDKIGCSFPASIKPYRFHLIPFLCLIPH